MKKTISEIHTRKIFLKSLDKILSKVFVDTKRKKNRRVVYYLRLYTDLVDAQACLNPQGYTKFLYNIERVIKFARSCRFADEKKYTKKINELLNSIIEKKKTPMKNYNHLEHLIKTRMKIAKNICIMRILSLV